MLGSPVRETELHPSTGKKVGGWDAFSSFCVPEHRLRADEIFMQSNRTLPRSYSVRYTKTELRERHFS